LDYFGLKSLDQLPPLSELREIPELEPQLELEPVVNADGTQGATPATEPVTPEPEAASEAVPEQDDDELPSDHAPDQGGEPNDDAPDASRDHTDQGPTETVRPEHTA